MPLRRSLQEETRARLQPQTSLRGRPQDRRAPVRLNAAWRLDTHTRSRPLLLHQASEAPARGLPDGPPQFWVRRPAPDPRPAGHCRRQRAGAHRRRRTHFFSFLRSAFLNLALFEHTRVNNGHRGKSLFSKIMEDQRQAGLQKTYSTALGAPVTSLPGSFFILSALSGPSSCSSFPKTMIPFRQ